MSAAAVAFAALAAAAAVWAVRATRRAADLRMALGRLADALATDERETLLEVVLDTARVLTGARVAVLWSDTGAAVVARMVRGDAGRGEAVVAVGDHGDPSDATMSATLEARGRPYGIIALYGGDTGRLGEVQTLVQQAGAAMDATYAHEEAQRMSITDGLTGLWNRRQFDVRCIEELDRAARFGDRFALVLCDVDDFKQVNDTHGHIVGDAVLVEIARRLVENTRGVDLVARYGGEEFGLVLPQTELDGAMRVAEHVREIVGATPVPTEAGPVQVTLSVGVACHPDHGTTIPVLTAAADAGLYVAKGSGKNQVRPAPAATETTETT